MWLSKDIPAPEWSDFFEACGWLQIEMQNASGIAIYRDKATGDHTTKIFAGGEYASIADRLSPSGWREVTEPNLDSVDLIAGAI